MSSTRELIGFLPPSSGRLQVLVPQLESITFNAHRTLALHSYSITTTSTQTVPDSAISRDDQLDRFTIQLDSSLAIKQGDEITLNLAWSAPLGTSLSGYYPCAYKDKHTQQEGIYALTLFGPTDARTVFPCWDEPALKATYSLSMISAESAVNLSNMDVLSETPVKDAPASDEKSEAWKITKFAKSPPMSTCESALSHLHIHELIEAALNALCRPPHIRDWAV